VFVPVRDSSDISSLLKYKWFAAGWLAVQSLLGWPMYLLFNASGREYSRHASHFDPFSPIFSRRERPGIVLSDLGLLAVGYGLYNLAQAFGWVWLVKTYFIPYLFVNFW
jgi:omega-6 fatty acid desaturase (delta-12 desaturase)